jgi:hypothetical protein
MWMASDGPLGCVNCVTDKLCDELKGGFIVGVSHYLSFYTSGILPDT